MRETFIAKRDVNGNRRTLMVNHHKRVMSYSGSFHGQCGIIHTNIPIKTVDQLARDYSNSGYLTIYSSDEISKHLS